MNSHNNLLNALSSEGIKVLEIWHSSRPNDIYYFETGTFREANNENHKHSISRCKDITHIVSSNKSVYINQPNTLKGVVTAIENLNDVSVSKEFSKDFSFIWHI